MTRGKWLPTVLTGVSALVLSNAQAAPKDSVPLEDDAEDRTPTDNTTEETTENPQQSPDESPSKMSWYCASEDPSVPEPGCVRGAAGGGFALARAGKNLDDVTRSYGPSFHFYFGFGPRRSPVIFGAQIDYVDYGGPLRTFNWQGGTRSYRIGTFSHQGLAMIRLAPERGIIRPYLDILGGYWLLRSEIRDGKGYFSDTMEAEGIGTRFVGAYGARVGVDILFRKMWGLGIAVQWTRGGKASLVNVEEIQVLDGELILPSARTVTPQQLHFMVSLAYDSWAGNWKVSSPRTTTTGPSVR